MLSQKCHYRTLSLIFFCLRKKNQFHHHLTFITQKEKKSQKTPAVVKIGFVEEKKKFLLNDKILLNPPKLKHTANLFEWWKKDYIFLENDKKNLHKNKRTFGFWISFFLFWNNLLSDIFFTKNRDKRKNKVCCFRRPNSQLTNHDFF